MKKRAGALCALLLCAAVWLPLPAAAATSKAASSAAVSAEDGTVLQLKDTAIKITVPHGLYAFTPDTPLSDPNLLGAGIDNWYTKRKELKEQSNILLISAPQQAYTIQLGQKQSAVTQQHFNMKTMTDAEIRSLMEELRKPPANSGGNTIQTQAKRYTSSAGLPFIYLQMQGKVEGKDVQECAYFTIINGYGYTLDTYRENGPLTQVQQDSLRQLTDTLQVTKWEQQPAAAQTNPAQSWLLLLLPLLILAVIILLVFMVGRVHRKHENQRKAILLERITAYRQKLAKREEEARQAGRTPAEPETLLENTTKYVKKTLQRFGWVDLLFHRKSLWVPLFTTAILCIVLAVIADAAAIRLLFLGITAFCILRPLMLPHKVYLTESGNLRKKKDRKVHYQFRKEDFRVSGIYSGVYPYVQILRVYEVERYFYFYLGANHVYILNKHSFTKGTPEELRRLLAETCPAYHPPRHPPKA